MFKKLSFLLLTSLLFCTLWGCSSQSFEPKNPPSKKNALSAYQPMSAYPGYFNSLTINGNINVIVTVDPKLRQVTATSPEGKTFESSVYYKNINRHLEIARGDADSKLSPPCVVIKTPSLNR